MRARCLDLDAQFTPLTANSHSKEIAKSIIHINPDLVAAVRVDTSVVRIVSLVVHGPGLTAPVVGDSKLAYVWIVG